MDTKRVDIAIIGAGPAGVSAALTAKARNLDVILFGNEGISAKVRKAHGIRNYPGLPDVSGDQLANAFQGHLDAMGVGLVQERVVGAYGMGDAYSIQTSTDAFYEATAVIVATGLVQARSLPGEDELLGKGVSYCATCDAFFFRGKEVAVLGYGPDAAAEAEFLAETCSRVHYLPLRGSTLPSAQNIVVVEGRPQAVVGEARVEALQTDAGRIPVEGVFVLREAVSPERLVPGLDIEGPHVLVDAQMRTTLPGCFACGDVVGKPYQYIKAAGQGNVAALSAAAYVGQLRKG